MGGVLGLVGWAARCVWLTQRAIFVFHNGSPNQERSRQKLSPHEKIKNRIKQPGGGRMTRGISIGSIARPCRTSAHIRTRDAGQIQKFFKEHSGFSPASVATVFASNAPLHIKTLNTGFCSKFRREFLKWIGPIRSPFNPGNSGTVTPRENPSPAPQR